MELLAGWLLLALILLISISVHEAAHALFMIRYGVRIENIIIGIPAIFKIRKSDPPISVGPILLLGGVSPNENDLRNARVRHNIIITLAGPIASILFGLLLIGITILAVKLLGTSLSFSPYQCQTDALNSFAWDTWGSFKSGGVLGVIFWTGIVSLTIGIGNLLPIPPLDGGRVFFLILEQIFGIWAKRIGQVVLIAGVILFLAYNLWIVGEATLNAGSTIINGSPIC